jgi:DNA-binding transcriptional MerR regulator
MHSVKNTGKQSIKHYTVKQLAKVANVSVRTLHYYDKIGLLKPAYLSGKGYRFYQRGELLRLQQILFYKELDIPLAEIAKILNDSSFSIVDSLKFHRRQLKNRVEHMNRLLETIDKTIQSIDTGNEMKDSELYQGFSAEEVPLIRTEAIEKWGQTLVDGSEQNIKQLGKKGWKTHQREADFIYQSLAELMEQESNSPQVQLLISQMHKNLCLYWDISLVAFRELGTMYVEDERFTQYYDKFKPGLAKFVRKAINNYVEHLNSQCELTS